MEAVLGLTDRTCQGLNAAQGAATTEAFVTTSRYEWLFRNMGWTLEGWPVW